ncbi:MAG: hypothetical protein K2P90_02435 [Holosporales bacterium]|nr:hypothetical protein [Holosporales bacterium]
MLRAASIRAPEVNVRKGPGMQYPIVWVLLCPGFPVKIVAEFGMWRKIEDSLGTKGWVHKSMLSSQKTLCLKTQQLLYQKPFPKGKPLAILRKRVVLDYLKSEEDLQGRWHYVRVNKLKGYVPAASCWGLDDLSLKDRDTTSASSGS